MQLDFLERRAGRDSYDGENGEFPPDPGFTPAGFDDKSL